MKKSVVISICSFIVGSVVGGVVAYKVTKTICDKEKEEEIESVKESLGKQTTIVFNSGEKDTSEKEENAEEPKEDEEQQRLRKIAEAARNKPPLEQCKSVIQKNNYHNVSAKDENDEEPEDPLDKPTLIDSVDFYENELYDKKTLNYYTDGVLLDEDDSIFEDEADAIGTDYMNHFDDGDEPNTVYIRNDLLRIDYEILRNMMSYKEYMGEE